MSVQLRNCYHLVFRFVVAIGPVLLALPPARGTSWGPRNDVGVAALDTRTGIVMWEAWRPEEIPSGTSPEQKAAVELLLTMTEARFGRTARVPGMTSISVASLAIKNAWPVYRDWPSPEACEGKTLTYYRHHMGVIALDPRTKKEVWRFLTTRSPFPSRVCEVGDTVAFIQIGSQVPKAIQAALLDDDRIPLNITKLKPPTPQRRLAAAFLLHWYGDGYLRRDLEKISVRLHDETEQKNRVAGPAARTIDGLLATWPKKRDNQRLLDGCVAAILRSDEGNPLRDFPWRGTERVLLWCLLQELVYGFCVDGYDGMDESLAYDGWHEESISLPPATKASLLKHCRSVVAAGPGPELPFAASMLVSTSIGRDRLTDAERRNLFMSADRSAWRWAAMSLARDGRREQLIEWARERPAEDHLAVLWQLNHGKSKEWSDAELAFWLACARRKPGDVATILRMREEPIPTTFRESIRSYLEREIAKPSVAESGTQPAYDLQAALDVLADWGDPSDTPLLLKYLRHPARNKAIHYDGASGEGTRLYVYDIRKRARELLQRRGAKLPPDVVYEEACRTKPSK